MKALIEDNDFKDKTKNLHEKFLKYINSMYVLFSTMGF